MADATPKKIKLDADADAQPPVVDVSEEAKIVQQVDYYFSDVNIINDKFLLEQVKKDQDGWVDLKVLMTFKKLKSLAKEDEKLYDALDKCKSQVIDYDSSKKRVRRREPLPNQENYQKELDLRTVHISGFPRDSRFEDLKRFCSQYGSVESLRMRHHYKSKMFKGCIHVVFKSQDDAKKVLDEEVTKCKDRELRKESMEKYHRRKEEIRDKRLASRKKKQKTSD